MNIAIIGTGNVGGALATKWANNGHRIYLGVRDTANFKGQDLLNNPNTVALLIQEAVQKAEVIDSLQTELFNANNAVGRYELTLEHLKEVNPKAAKQFEDYLNHETE